ncbi:pseudouridine synthase [Phaeodactylibacter xiamenensis]|uniref:pseudouridine synthase n=1 Tax=Phaeodactylibacter xiamenensis TaxID=1524460 RepID=UPI0005C78E20|nr:pseudouridine synthase [Phaeodactylibacter xiamenensis]
MSDLRYYILNKPYGVLSQFTREHPDHRVLGDLYDFPGDVYPVGRLDKDSEGLLIITNDKALTHRLLDPKFEHPRTYWVQVEGIPDREALSQLRKGVAIRIKKQTHRTRPARVELFTSPPPLPERDPPVRFRKTVPDSWLSIQLTEGKNRQVRRMCAAVGFPVLRLVRTQIQQLNLSGLPPGQVKALDHSTILSKLKITPQ